MPALVEQGRVDLGWCEIHESRLVQHGEDTGALRRDGVVVKILTGDNELVAQHVCDQVGLDSARILGGDEIEHMTDGALAEVAEHTTVFARVSPAQNNCIILALKSRNHGGESTEASVCSTALRSAEHGGRPCTASMRQPSPLSLVDQWSQ